MLVFVSLGVFTGCWLRLFGFVYFIYLLVCEWLVFLTLSFIHYVIASWWLRGFCLWLATLWVWFGLLGLILVEGNLFGIWFGGMLIDLDLVLLDWLSFWLLYCALFCLCWLCLLVAGFVGLFVCYLLIVLVNSIIDLMLLRFWITIKLIWVEFVYFVIFVRLFVA